MEFSPKTILITGATSGLGQCAASKFLQQGHTVIITGRNESKLQQAMPRIRQHAPASSKLFTAVMDQTNVDSIKQAVTTLKRMNIGKLDIVIHNAGGLQPEHEMIQQHVEKTIFVNAVAPWYLTLQLIPFMQEQESRILFVTSSIHDPDVRGGKNESVDAMLRNPDLDNLDGHVGWETMSFYRLSKLVQLWLMYLLAEKYPSFSINAFCPGFVPTTPLHRHSSWYIRLLMHHVLSWMPFATSEDDAAESYVYYATHELFHQVTGKYFKKKQVTESSKASKDMTKARQVWNMACDICELPNHRLE
ncbi:NAD(P)-binding protein [Lichtheimia hyalospora FSU 10163]|nr:NAD(P)-binding protein [Lichtheimia hyalospora FSU 10163]